MSNRQKPLHTKSEILKVILKHPNGIEEVEIRHHLKEKLNIRDERGVKRHLSDLKNDFKVIERTARKGKSNIWFVRPERVLNLIEKFNECEDEIIEWLAIKKNEIKVENIPKILNELKTNPRVVRFLQTDVCACFVEYMLQNYRILIFKLWKRDPKMLERLCSTYNIPYERVKPLIKKRSSELTPDDREVLGEIKVADLDERFKIVIKKLCLVSPSCFLTLFKFLDAKIHLSYDEVENLFRILLIDRIPALIPVNGIMADVVQRELGVLLYSALREDIENGVLDIYTLNNIINECEEEIDKITGRDKLLKGIRINGRKSIIKKIKGFFSEI